MGVNDKANAIIPKGTLTRRFGDAGKQTVFSDKFSHTPVLGRKSQTLALVEGDLLLYQVNHSFTLYGGTTHELMNFNVIASAQKALVIIILLEGKLDFSYDYLTFELDANSQKCAVVVSLTKPVSFHRKLYKDNNVSKLNISLPLSWIKNRNTSNGNIGSFISEHLAHFQLDLNTQLLGLSREIIKLSSPVSFIEKMKIEALTQRLLLEVFEQLSDYNVAGSAIVKCEDNKTQSIKANFFEQKLDKLIVYIEENIEQSISTHQLAELALMSVSSLQRNFKRSLGCSLQSYIRRRRLEIAKQKLERGLITITEAAYTAGYRYPSNFTNAFKKMFGYPPKITTKKRVK